MFGYGRSQIRHVEFRLVQLHDLTYAVEMTMPDGAWKVIKGFGDEDEAYVWLAKQKRRAPKKEVWAWRPPLRWR